MHTSVIKFEEYYIDLYSVSCICVEQYNGSFGVSIYFAGCLKPAIEMSLPMNDITTRKVQDLTDRFKLVKILDLDVD
jgi:hypothetical protein